MNLRGKRIARFFGGAAEAPVPTGLCCVHCRAPFAPGDLGLWFEREGLGCFPAHPMCFANAAVDKLLATFRPS